MSNGGSINEHIERVGESGRSVVLKIRFATRFLLVDRQPSFPE